MAKVLHRFGAETVNVCPHGVGTNSPAALIVHACSAAQYWVKHIGLGRQVECDRAAEFDTVASIDELRAMRRRQSARHHHC
jgi:hypothetical protein